MHCTAKIKISLGIIKISVNLNSRPEGADTPADLNLLSVQAIHMVLLAGGYFNAVKNQKLR